MTALQKVLFITTGFLLIAVPAALSNLYVGFPLAMVPSGIAGFVIGFGGSVLWDHWNK